MNDGAASHERPLDSHSSFDECSVLIRGAVKAGFFCLNIGVEGSPESKVITDLTQSRYTDRFIQGQDEGRNIFKIDALHTPIRNPGTSDNQAGGCVDLYSGLRLGCR